MPFGIPCLAKALALRTIDQPDVAPTGCAESKPAIMSATVIEAISAVCRPLIRMDLVRIVVTSAVGNFEPVPAAGPYNCRALSLSMGLQAGRLPATRESIIASRS